MKKIITLLLLQLCLLQFSYSQTGPPTYIIPVVFHVIHYYGYEDISDAQIFDALNSTQKSRTSNIALSSPLPMESIPLGFVICTSERFEIFKRSKP